ncbi:hypothetical protein FIBSPDRAFT_900503 [Athelia psychrophila]|uniref:Uncharacterized protein n=1 Tax=Athelia psychrophila TaxID=1759441 RepID=A0A165YEY8_9AGAM|nr:hypothetical protein FIBSPDRAFT_900503 [Fibularhizoctonia sp. CBS 109695]
MDTIVESEEAGNKATVIFHAQGTSGGMVNSVNGNFMVDDQTYIEHVNYYITNTAVRPEGNHEYQCGIYSPRPPRNETDMEIDIDTIAAPSHSVHQPQRPGAFKLSTDHINTDVVVQSGFPSGSDNSLAIIVEADHCRQLLKKLLSSLANCCHALSAAMLHCIHEYEWSRASECTAFNGLNSRLRECHGSFTECILALGSFASAELEWGTGTGNLTELHNFFVLFKQESTSLQHIRMDTVIVINHLACPLPVPTIFCKLWQILQRFGWGILSSEDDKIINPLDFSTVLQPGMTVEMSVVLHEREEESLYGSKEHKCPQCGHLNSEAVTPNRWVSCQNCYGRFQNSPEDDIMISPAVQQAENNPLPKDRSFFRKISVLKGGTRETDATAEETADEQDRNPENSSQTLRAPRRSTDSPNSGWLLAPKGCTGSPNVRQLLASKGCTGSPGGCRLQSERSSAASSQGMYRPFEQTSAASTQRMHRKSEWLSAASRQGMYRQFKQSPATSIQGMHGQLSAAGNQGMYTLSGWQVCTWGWQASSGGCWRLGTWGWWMCVVLDGHMALADRHVVLADVHVVLADVHVALADVHVVLASGHESWQAGIYAHEGGHMGLMSMCGGPGRVCTWGLGKHVQRPWASIHMRTEQARMGAYGASWQAWWMPGSIHQAASNGDD